MLARRRISQRLLRSSGVIAVTTGAMLSAISLFALMTGPRPLPIAAYSSTAAARKAWSPQFGSAPVRVERLPDGSRCLAFDVSFSKPGDRACWDWHGSLDLSSIGRVTFEIAATNGSVGATLGVYFGTPGGWYAAFRSAAIPDTWTPISLSLSSFKPEGRPAGWDKITTFRLSIWAASPGKATYRLRHFAALDADPAENFVKNGSFEIVAAGLPYAWGSGHWGLGHLPWATNPDLWRRHFRLDRSTSKHGRTSLRLDNTPDLPLLSAFSVWITPPPHIKTVAVSAWLKSDREALPVVIQCTNTSRKFTVGRKWQQFVLAPVPARKRMTVIISPKAPGTLWIDAVQMQAGDAATADFHASAADVVIAAREKLTDWSAPARDAQTARGRSVSGPLPRNPTRCSVDRHGRFLLNGHPYLHHSLGLEFVSDLSIIDFIARSGFSDICIHFRPNLALPEIKKIFDRCAQNGLHLIPWLNRNIPRDQFAAIITALKGHPSLLAWYVYDEPHGEGFAEAEARCKLAKQLDPNHPAFINYLSSKLQGHKGDIYSTDVYPIPHSTPMAAISAVEKMAAAAAPEHKPVWMWLQGTGYAYWMDREPSPRELSCMVYGSLIRGARGIYYFAQIPRSALCWAEMRAMCVEVARLAPVLYSLDSAPGLRCDDPAILCRAFRRADSVWVLAVNTSRQPRRARFTIDTSPRTVEVVFEDRTIRPSDRSWSDRFGQYERHVYRLTPAR